MINLRLPKPNPKQVRLFKDKHKYIAYGGARGGGKSWAIRIKALLLALFYFGIEIIIIRRTFPELTRNHINPLRKIIPRAIAVYNDKEKVFKFRNGSRINFGYCDSENDMAQYQGAEYDIIMIDEATQFDERVFAMFKACLRAVNKYPKRIYLTCNPGGRGHAWVKRLFIDHRFKGKEKPEEYTFIPALVTDNVALMRAQPEYIEQLETLPPKLRKAWLEGDWNVLEGMFFEEFTDDPEHYDDRRWTHVIKPFTPKSSYALYRSFDFGYNKPFSVGWWAVSPDNVMYRILEFYGCREETPNEGVRMVPDEIFKRIERIEREHPYLKGREIHGVADPSIWDKSRGVSVADSAAKHGIYFTPGDNERIPGWMQVHYRLQFDTDGFPMLYVFDNCKAFIRTIPELIYSELDPEDLDTKLEDHVADEVRYFCMSSPLPPRVVVDPEPIPYDPLDLYKDRELMKKKNYVY